VPCLCKVAPSSAYHLEDVHRAGGIPSILGELDRAGLLNREVRTVHSASLDEFLDRWIWAPRRSATKLSSSTTVRPAESAHPPVLAVGPLGHAGHRPGRRLHQGRRARLHRDGGLAVLYGNIAPDGAIVKTPGCRRTVAVLRPAWCSRARKTRWRGSSAAR